MGKTSQRFVERITQHVPTHLVDSTTSKKRRGRPPKVRKKPAEGHQSEIACHLAANEDCRKTFRARVRLEHSLLLPLQASPGCFGGDVNVRSPAQTFI